MWVQLLLDKHIEIGGEAKLHHAGEIINVGKRVALQWVAGGDARAWGVDEKALVADGGIIITSPESGYMAAGLKARGLEVAVGPLATPLPYAKTLFWNPNLHLRAELVPVGFMLLDTWECAVPLLDYDVLAVETGTAQERQETQTIIHDLRVLLYDTRLIFAKKGTDGERLIEAFAVERSQGGSEHLAFLRALWAVKPLICALPTTWIGKLAG